ncbi:MAG: hypothetical protein K8S94_03330 [Planctomycetia bacterium]|nr:hypothetical protein [Planctomycetia bacterium]
MIHARSVAALLLVAVASTGTLAEAAPKAEQTGTPRRVLAADSSKKTLASIAATGEVEWRLPVGAIHDLQLLPDGHLLYQDGWTRIIEVDHDGVVRREIKLTVDSSSAHSDTRNARKTDAGTYLVAHEKDGVVREYAPDGAVIWEFDVPLFDKPRQGGHGPEAFGDQTYSAERLPNGNTLIVNCHAGPDQPQILEVTPDKRVVWTFKDFTTFGNSMPVAVV